MAISQPSYPVETNELVTHVGAYTDTELTALEAALLPVFEDVSTGWPTRPTLNGDAIPWPLKWIGLPGSVESPVANMAEFDEFLPVPEA